jgi:RNA-binding protein
VLTSKQRSYLSALAQTRDALVTLGKAGESEGVVARLDSLLADHELVKLRFGVFKEARRELALSLAQKTDSELVRLIGYTAIFYRLNPDPQKHRIDLPEATLS